MKDQIIINKRYCGPKDSGNGGYVCGLMAHYITGVAEVTLFKPPPLERNLNLEQLRDKILLRDGEALVAEAIAGTLNIRVPEPPNFEIASRAIKSYRGFEYHALPHCYVCGTLRKDGMNIYPSPIPNRDIVASPWIPENYQAQKDGKIREEFQWAALDCPGFFAIHGHTTRLLGRLKVKLEHPVSVGEKCITIGWHIKSNGRKHTTGTALFSESGIICGTGLATWIELKPSAE